MRFPFPNTCRFLFAARPQQQLLVSPPLIGFLEIVFLLVLGSPCMIFVEVVSSPGRQPGRHRAFIKGWSNGLNLCLPTSRVMFLSRYM